MGIESLCNAVANAVKHEADNNGILHGKVIGSIV